VYTAIGLTRLGEGGDGGEGLVAQFELDKNAQGQFIWRFRANNGRIVADSAESYYNRADCENGINIVKREGPMAAVKDLTAR